MCEKMSLSMQIQSRPLLNLNVNKNPFDSQEGGTKASTFTALCATLIRSVFYLFNEVNMVYIANGLFMNMSEVFIWKAYSKDDKNYH